MFFESLVILRFSNSFAEIPQTVIDNQIKLGHKVKIVRRETIVGEGIIKELQQAKVKTSEVNQGFEFGAMIESKIELAPGDIIKDFIIVEK